MSKTATVKRDVKNYRRALEALHHGHGHVFHGTPEKKLEGILEHGRVQANPGAYGTGAYFSSGRPASRYWSQRTGIIAPKENAVAQGLDHVSREPEEPWHSAPKGYQLQPKDTAVFDRGTPPKNLLEAQKKLRIRAIPDDAMMLAELRNYGHLSGVDELVRNPRQVGAKDLVGVLTSPAAYGAYSKYVSRPLSFR